VNVLFAGVAVTGALILIGKQVSWGKTRLDIPSALLVSGGMFSIVYGFSNVALHNWHTPSTWGFLVAGALLLVTFVWWQTRSTAPLLPLSIVRNRNRGGAYLAMFLSGAGMFGVLLFLNYYMQQNLGYSPVKTGLAFLPMVALTMTITNISNIVLMPRTGPRPLVVMGMLLGAASAGLLTRLGVHSTYAADILPSIILIGTGLGLIFAPVADTGTAGVAPQDTGVASATVNTGNQLGGSIGTSLLNSLFASAVATYIAGNFAHGSVAGRPTRALTEMASLHGYTTAFWWVMGIFGVGAVICGLLLRSGPLARYAPSPLEQAPAWNQPVAAPQPVTP
jgi:predicted MFS family arabinose efflux permease